MNRSAIHEAISRNLARANVQVDQIRVQPEPFGGWRVAVVAPGFQGRPTAERRALALAGLEDARVEWLELLTPEEREWAGVLPLDSDLEELPLWGPALARAGLERAAEQAPVFPSDLDTDLERPLVATFYSVRGGVGRSTALAYTGRILASRGRRVICVDMDLEAPGLAALFGFESALREGQGLLHILVALDRGEQPDISGHLLRVAETDELYCLPAGRPDANYARLLGLIDPEAWYREERNPLRELFSGLARRLPFTPDVVLVDARTGISSLNGPLLFDIADLAVVVFFPHPQSKTAAEALVRALLCAKTRRSVDGQRLTPEPRFLVSPVPAVQVPEVVRRYQHRPLEWISEWLASAPSREGSETTEVEPDITHFVSYREVLATSDRILPQPDIWRDFEPVADWIERFLPQPDERPAPHLSEHKGTILDQLSFSAGAAEDHENLLATFVETEIVRKALDPAVPLVLGRKGAGKTAIYRRLAETEDLPRVVVSAPSKLRGTRQWLLGPDGFEAVDTLLTSRGGAWRQFWLFYTCVASHCDWPADQAGRPASPQGIDAAGGASGQHAVVQLFERLVGVDRWALLAHDWLERMDRALSQTTLLLFDGLDTGFGSSETERDRRRRALEGLLDFLVDEGDRLRNFRFKILLREDIWRKLSFENKSHLYGRWVTLEWHVQAAYFKVAIKQALESRTFREYLQRTQQSDSWGSVDSWGEKEVSAAWNVLVGERMKGGKTAFTRNWTWNRLADAKGDHSPRYLLQLFRAITDWERAEQSRNPYEKCIIRPRALIQSLPTVSRQALDALSLEEFPELAVLLTRLTQIGRTPVLAQDLRDLEEQVSLAREVGLLGVYEGTEDSVERYKVPEIYRHALGMTRKGQA